MKKVSKVAEPTPVWLKEVYSILNWIVLADRSQASWPRWNPQLRKTGQGRRGIKLWCLSRREGGVEEKNGLTCYWWRVIGQICSKLASELSPDVTFVLTAVRMECDVDLRFERAAVLGLSLLALSLNPSVYDRFLRVKHRSFSPVSL